jgi:hypothetical protein
MKLRPKKYGDKHGCRRVTLEGGAAIKTEDTGADKFLEIIKQHGDDQACWLSCVSDLASSDGGVQRSGRMTTALPRLPTPSGLLAPTAYQIPPPLEQDYTSLDDAGRAAGPVRLGSAAEAYVVVVLDQRQEPEAPWYSRSDLE